jgi:hypothetical protein
MSGDPSLNIAFRKLATSSWCLSESRTNFPSTIVLEVTDEIPSIFTLNDFKLRKE